MKLNEDFSDEILNAFIDEQLDHDERVQILSALRHDEVLTQRICDLQKIRNLVQLAYSQKEIVPEHQLPATEMHQSSLRKGVAASILIVTGILGGWFSHQQLTTENNLVQYAQTIRNNPAISEHETWQVMLHVSHNEARRFKVLLNETENLLATYKKNNQPVHIEILANGKGLDLIKDESSPHSIKLKQLKAKYNNLIVSACGQTLQRIKKETGKSVALIPEANVVRSAIYQISKRQKQGWTYIHI